MLSRIFRRMAFPRVRQRRRFKSLGGYAAAAVSKPAAALNGQRSGSPLNTRGVKMMDDYRPASPFRTEAKRKIVKIDAATRKAVSGVNEELRAARAARAADEMARPPLESG